ncbi:MAG: SRPBCC domain-containing protein [Methanomicrobiales archaeon]|nr:SRPBCC domain-containing protein [Methanomicrobiales archaeon]
MKGIVARQSVFIRAPPARVWKALTDPDFIKEYLFGTQVSSDWKVGSPIRYRGVWEGRAYEDKGTVLRVVPERLLETTFWSSLSGLADTPENYKKVTYELIPEAGGTRLTVIQDNNTTEEERNHSEQNWKMVLEKLKDLLEN